MTADCVFSRWAVQTNLAFLYFSSGEFTINGNGYSIIGPASANVSLYVGDGTSGAVLNLNDVTVRQAGDENAVISVDGGRLNARNLIFRDNHSTWVLSLNRGGQAYLENARVLNNRGVGSDTAVFNLGSSGGPLLRITNGVFRGNTDFDYFIEFAGAVELRGCITLADGLDNNQRPGGVLTDRRSCKRKKEEKLPTATATLRPLAVTCPVLSQFGIAVHATYGLASGVQCQRLDGGGIGIQSIVEAGFIEAVDIWGYVEQGVEVCFPQSGRLLFLDARTMPRAITPLESTVVEGMTCASIASPGSIVLMPS